MISRNSRKHFAGPHTLTVAFSCPLHWDNASWPISFPQRQMNSHFSLSQKTQIHAKKALNVRNIFFSWFIQCVCDTAGWGSVLQVGKVAGSIPDSVIGVFQWNNPSGQTVALGSTQPLTKEYQVYFVRGKAAGAYGWQPYHLNVPTVLTAGRINHLEPSGPVQTCTRLGLRFYSVSLHTTSNHSHGPCGGPRPTGW